MYSIDYCKICFRFWTLLCPENGILTAEEILQALPCLWLDSLLHWWWRENIGCNGRKVRVGWKNIHNLIIRSYAIFGAFAVNICKVAPNKLCPFVSKEEVANALDFLKASVDDDLFCYRHSQCWRKQLLASSCLCVCPSVRME